MGTARLDTEIQKYLPLLGNEEKKTLLSVIKSFIQLKKELPGKISMEKYNKEIDEAMARMDKGEYISHEEVEKDMESW